MSSQVGSGHISIFPVMTGFKGAVMKGTQAAGAAGAKTFDGGFKGAGRKVGRTLGTDVKAAFGASAGDLGSVGMRKLNREVATAAAGLSRSRLKQQDEAGKVRVAEVKLQEAIAKSGEGSSAAVAAEERLASARRSHKAATDTVTAATTRLKGAQEAVRTATSAAATSATSSGSLWSRFTGNVRDNFQQLSTSQAGFARASTTGFGSAASALTLFKSSAASAGAGVGAVAKAAGATFASLGPGIASSMKAGLQALPGAAASGLSSLVSGMRDLGSRAGKALGGALQGAATVAVAGLGASFAIIGANAISTIKSAVAEYATWEQAVGGVETLFKSAAGSVQNYASEAYRTAGVSANEYMSQVTSFSASLIGSLGGDTKAAAELANRAVIDMSDNANKMGTDLASIQQTYQSIARGNYGMLDNLKLGYGGTKTEMERLLADAEKLSGQKYSIGNFSEVVSAIHVVQTELGITGTTALEAATTIEGATAAMKSSWKNWLAELGKEDADISGVTDQLASSVGVAMGNLLPRIQQIIKGLVAAIPQMVSGLVQTLPQPFQDVVGKISGTFSGLKELIAPLGAAFLALGSGGLAAVLAKVPILGGMLGGLTGPLAALGGPLGIVTAAFAAFALTGGDAGALVEGLTGVIDQVVAALPGLIAKVTEFVPKIVAGIYAQIPAFLAAATGVVEALVSGLVQAVPLLVDGAVALVSGLMAAIMENLPAIIEGAIALVTALVSGIVTALPLLVEGAVALVAGMLTAIVTALPMIIEGGVQLLTAIITGLIAALPMLLEAALTLVTGLLEAIISNLPMIIQAGIQLLLSLITGIINMLPQLITAAITLVLKLVAGLLQMLPQLIAAGIQLVLSLIVGLVKAIPQIIAMLPQIVKAIWDGLASVDWLSLGVDIVMGIIKGLSSMGQAVLDAIVDLASSAFDGFKDFFGIKSPARKMIQPGRDIVRGAVAGVDAQADSLGDSLVDMAQHAAKRAEDAMTSVTATMSATMNGEPGQDARNTGQGSATKQVNINNEIKMYDRDPRIVGKQIGRSIEEALV
ncbi:phage tail protein [Leucobacter salsicius]|uniref:phage tail protein n=1 Tax=Leucobacter salsicius TaxID=664638 RepID=UPI000349F90D|nr:hypothetical protein [Leucobacter salsicius]